MVWKVRGNQLGTSPVADAACGVVDLTLLGYDVNASVSQK